MNKAKNNVRFGEVIAPLMRPFYVLQMARSKSWSKEAQIKHLKNFSRGCRMAQDRADSLVKRLEQDN